MAMISETTNSITFHDVASPKELKSDIKETFQTTVSGEGYPPVFSTDEFTYEMSEEGVVPCTQIPFEGVHQVTYIRING